MHHLGLRRQLELHLVEPGLPLRGHGVQPGGGIRTVAGWRRRAGQRQGDGDGASFVGGQLHRPAQHRAGQALRILQPLQGGRVGGQRVCAVERGGLHLGRGVQGLQPGPAVHLQLPPLPGQLPHIGHAAGGVEELLRRVHLPGPQRQQQGQLLRHRQRVVQGVAGDQLGLAAAAFGTGLHRQAEGRVRPVHRGQGQVALAQCGAAAAGRLHLGPAQRAALAVDDQRLQ